MAALEGVDAAWRALQGDQSSLLVRLRECNLSPDEKRFIEDRLTGKGAKMKRGPKVSAVTASQHQAIIECDAWLRYIRDYRKQYVRIDEIMKVSGLSATQIRTILRMKPSITTMTIIDFYKKLGILVRSGMVSDDVLPPPYLVRSETLIYAF